jgi:hypothetical protein
MGRALGKSSPRHRPRSAPALRGRTASGGAASGLSSVEMCRSSVQVRIGRRSRSGQLTVPVRAYRAATTSCSRSCGGPQSGRLANEACVGYDESASGRGDRSELAASGGSASEVCIQNPVGPWCCRCRQCPGCQLRLRLVLRSDRACRRRYRRPVRRSSHQRPGWSTAHPGILADRLNPLTDEGFRQFQLDRRHRCSSPARLRAGRERRTCGRVSGARRGRLTLLLLPSRRH